MRCKIQPIWIAELREVSAKSEVTPCISVPRMSLREDEEDERKRGTLVAAAAENSIGLKCSAHALVLYWVLFKVIFYFPNRKSTIWGIYSEYFLFFEDPLSKSKYMIYLNPRKDKALPSIQQQCTDSFKNQPGTLLDSQSQLRHEDLLMRKIAIWVSLTLL